MHMAVHHAGQRHVALLGPARHPVLKDMHTAVKGTCFKPGIAKQLQSKQPCLDGQHVDALARVLIQLPARPAHAPPPAAQRREVWPQRSQGQCRLMGTS